MTETMPHCSRSAGCALLLTLVLLSPAHRAAAATPIYKCFDGNLALLYTDEPCKDGELLNIRAGDADPAAVARLERVRDTLDRSAAERIADDRHAAMQRDFAPWYASEEPPIAYEDMVANAAYDYGAAWWLPGFAHHHPRTRPAKPFLLRHFAVTPHHLAPRR